MESLCSEAVNAVRVWAEIILKREPQSNRARLAVELSSCMLEHYHLGLDLNQCAATRNGHRERARHYFNHFVKTVVHQD